MPSWDVSPSGVQGVLTSTGSVATEFTGELERVVTALQTSADSSGSGLVAGALVGFATRLGTDMQAVADRTSSAMSGCARAVQAYVAGDAEMAANAARSAAAAPVPAPPGVPGPR